MYQLVKKRNFTFLVCERILLACRGLMKVEQIFWDLLFVFYFWALPN